MLGLFSLLGLLMAGLVGGSIALRPDEDPEQDSDTSEADLANDDPAPTAPDHAAPRQLWDEGGDDTGGGEGGVATLQAGEIAAADGDDPAANVPGTNLTGSDRGDGLEGADGADTLTGLAGDDQIDGGRGDDLMFGGDGDDTLTGGFGQDTLLGGAGADYLAGHEGDDDLAGDDGDDTLLGGNGQDSLSGGAGDDWLAGGMGDDLLVAGPGTDTLDGDAGNDTLVGAFGNTGDTWGNYLNAGIGNDVLRIGAGDIATGGAGADRFELSSDQAAGGFARIMDFDAGQDELVVLYDGSGPAPVVSLAPGGLPDEVMVLLNGQPMAQVVGGATTLTPGAIRLVAG